MTPVPNAAGLHVVFVAVAIVTSPPPGMASRALTTRLMMALEICVSSA
jgi:hypothetical protein